MSEPREIVPEGTYVARGKSAEMGVSAVKKTPFVRVAYCIDEGEWKGRFVRFDGYLTDDTKKRTAEALSYSGCTFPDDNFEDFTGLGDKPCFIVVEHERFTPDKGDKAGEEQTYARVAFVNQLGGMREDLKMSDVQKKSFASSMKGLLMNMRGNRPAPPASPNKPAASRAPAAEVYDGGNDDIPF
jgi:hypothetical protein